MDQAAVQWAPSDKTSRPIPAWRQRRRERILGAAADLFAARPYALVSMDELAAAAGMGKATLYRYYSSKEDLHVAVFEMVLERLARLLDQALSEGGGPKAILERMIAVLTPALGEHFRGLRASDDSVIQVAERKRRLFRNRRHLITSRIEEVMNMGVATGELRALRPSVCANMIVGMIWTCSVSMTEPPDAIAGTIADMFLNGAAVSLAR